MNLNSLIGESESGKISANSLIKWSHIVVGLIGMRHSELLDKLIYIFHYLISAKADC